MRYLTTMTRALLSGVRGLMCAWRLNLTAHYSATTSTHSAKHLAAPARCYLEGRAAAATVPHGQERPARHQPYLGRRHLDQEALRAVRCIPRCSHVRVVYSCHVFFPLTPALLCGSSDCDHTQSKYIARNRVLQRGNGVARSIRGVSTQAFL